LGFFPPQKHPALRAQIGSLSPDEGTPLADGVRQAGALLDGRNKESLMVVISDGEESCNGDPCAVARQLAQSKPNLKINVVDILGTGAGNCLAKATGGQVFTARNVDEMNVMLQKAAKEAIGPGNCQG
jgi:Mg-chelatase subunit ChlD